MRYLAILIAVFLGGTVAYAQDAYIRVVDVGQGLCVVAREPTGRTLLYDAGYSGDFCPDAVRRIVGDNPLDLVVISHSDADHISDAETILKAHGARTILHPEDNRTGVMLDSLRRELRAQAAAGATVRSMASDPPAFGETFPLGDAVVRFVAGWRDGLQTGSPGDPSLPAADRRNALSLVVRFEYGGRSVLLTGDTIGRRRNEPILGNRACRNAEKLMTEGSVPIDSDILIGQHHGGNNSTSNCFIRAVSPSWVVFSAGRGHGHPAQSVADRLVAWGRTRGLTAGRILRTDRGDDVANDHGQWVTGSIAGCRDEAGDDDVEIWVPRQPSQPLRVAYKQASSGC